MKIACIGNTNNSFFALTRYLRDFKLNVDLLLLNEPAHFHPSADSYDLSYQKFTKQLSWGHTNFWQTSEKTVEDDLKEYDFLIACGPVPAYVERIGRKIDLLIPYGSDFYEYPFYKFGRIPKLKKIKKYKFAKYQKAGIEKSRFISWDVSNNEFEEVLKKFNFSGKRLKIACPFIYVNQYNPDVISNYFDRSHWYKEFKVIRENNDFIIFHHSRLSWKNPPDIWSYKANDKLIRAFNSFVKKNTDIKSALILLEYGPDVYETKKLIKELEIESQVFWFPMMSRKDIMIGIHLSDLGAGEFGRSWFSYGAIYEFISMEKPVVHFRNDSLYKNVYPDMYPMFSAENEHNIEEVFLRYKNDREVFKNVGRKAREWFIKYVVQKPLKTYLEIIKS